MCSSDLDPELTWTSRAGTHPQITQISQIPELDLNLRNLRNLRIGGLVHPSQIGAGLAGRTPNRSASEEQFQSELNLPRGKRRTNGSERRTGDVGTGPPEVGVVQEIEELRPELQGQAFACRNLETLVDS